MTNVTPARRFLSAGLCAALAAFPAAAHEREQSGKPRKGVSLAEMCRDQNILRFQVVPEPGRDVREDRKAARRRAGEDRRRATEALGRGVSTSLSPDFVQTVSWDKPAGTQKVCRDRLSGFVKAFPGRVRAVVPRTNLKKARERMEGQVPEKVRENPRRRGLLSWLFDRTSSRAEAATVSAGGPRGARGAVHRWRDARRPAAQIPSRFTRRHAAPPAPRRTISARRPTATLRDTASRYYDRARRGASDAYRRSRDTAVETYRSARSETGDIISGLSSAMGAPWSGGLRRGVQLPKTGAGYRFVRYGQWGTDRLVNGIRHIGRQLNANGFAMEVGDMSYKNGGPIRRHRSHQNGRDVDIFFVGGSGRGFNARANWLLLRSALENPHMRVSNVFISNQKKAALLNHARSTRDPLASRAASVMSYEPGHNDHFHIRIL